MRRKGGLLSHPKWSSAPVSPGAKIAAGVAKSDAIAAKHAVVSRPNVSTENSLPDLNHYLLKHSTSRKLKVNR